MSNALRLNAAQQKAVNHVYGPLLVLAGPGTGKTQLLSARIANILQKTDASPQNILCLTFTESAAQNMRERLSSMIGADAYDVHIATYHGFGSDIIRSYPEFFEEIDLETGKDSRLERPIDVISQIEIMQDIIGSLPYDNPLIGARHYIKSVVSTVSELKRGLYGPEKLRALADQNLSLVTELSPYIADALKDVKRFPSKAEQSITLFEQIHGILDAADGSLVELAREELEEALSTASDSGKSTPLTTWKNQWLKKDDQNHFTFTDRDQHLRIRELARIYELYQEKLASAQAYDFDDMILRSIEALKTHDELKYNLQEKYQFILLDEFQDTNAAQFELVKLLGDNPVNEGQPNIFAVGDDDQAIYAFQGAHASNMLQFVHAYRDVAIVNLTENYRSHPDIIHIAHNVAQQIESRLHHNLDGVNKVLEAKNTGLPKNATIERHEFNAEANELSWVAQKIADLVVSGVPADEIAVLAPQHKYLESIVPFLATHAVPIAYEKRENILETPLILSLQMMVQLIMAAHDNDERGLNEFMPRVLSLEFYQIPVVEIWKVNWALRERDNERSWVEIALDNDVLAPHVLFYLSLGLRADSEPLEYVLDYLIGSCELELDAELTYKSPLKRYYFSDRESRTLRYYEMLAHLSTIREHVRSYQQREETHLKAEDFLRFIAAYNQAEQPLINAHPIAQATSSVQLMTAFKAKGLEFEHVFLLSLHDDIWGKKARGNANKLSLPSNLQHIRYQGSSEDELRRILFVAITRAKHGLYLTSHATKDTGKATEPVKYLLEATNENKQRVSNILPTNAQAVRSTEFSAEHTHEAIETMWHSRHLELDASLKDLLKERLASYQMSPTHLNTFIDMEYGDPETFLLNTLLQFPQAPSEDGEFGTAIHATLDWFQKRTANGAQPTTEATLSEFDIQLTKRYVAPERRDDLRRRGHTALRNYLPAASTMFARTAKSEVDFRKEGVLVGDAHLNGKIDRLEIDTEAGTVRIVDFKTGKPHDKWDRSVKLLKYKQQLYFYKFLIEGSHTWKGYTVEEARLEFVEPDQNGKIQKPLSITFSKDEEKETKQLIETVWQKIKAVDLPDTAPFSEDYKGTTQFIESLL